jgi:Leucine-rich repeat (LRR) protein
MKLIITEEQYRLIIENENSGKLLALPVEMIDTSDKIERMLERYNQDKERRNFMGINIIGNFHINDVDPDLYDDISLRNLMKEVVSVRGDLILYGSSVSELPKLRYVERNLVLEDTMTEELPSLVEVGGDLNVNYTFLDEIPLLEKVGRINLSDTSIKSIPKLREAKTINGNYSEIRFLPSLESVSGDVDLMMSQITDLPKLRYVGGRLLLGATPFAEKLREMNVSKDELKNKFGVNNILDI